MVCDEQLHNIDLDIKYYNSCSTTKRQMKYEIYLFIEGNPHRVTSGLFTKLTLTEVENNTRHAYFTNVKHINIIRKLVLSVLLS